MAPVQIKSLLAFLMLFLAETPLSSGQDYKIPFASVESCAKSSSTQFFNIGGLRCQTCGSSMMASNDGLSCQCDSGYKEVHGSSVRGIEISCQACDEVVTQDGKNCIGCANGPPNPATGACHMCTEREIRVEYYITGRLQDNSECKACDSSKKPNADGSECVLCHPSLNSDCNCPTPNVLSGGICFLVDNIAPGVPSDYNVPFQSSTEDGVVASWFFTDYFRSAESLCNLDGNLTACQLLGNLCVMVDYNQDDYGATCNAYKEISDLQTVMVNHILDWPDGMPWLFYSDDAEQVLTETTIHTTFKSNTSSEQSMLNIYLAEYNVTGHFRGIFPAKDGRLQLCTDTTERLNAAYVFGTTYTSSCTIPSQKFWDSYETVFIDPYLWFQELNGDYQLYAVPVLVDTLKKSNSYVNRATSNNNWQLTRRLFLVDNVSGKTAVDAPSSIVRYASEIEIIITLQHEEGQARNGRIYPPLMKVKYSELTRERDYVGNTSARVVFKVTYSMDQSRSRKGLSITLGVLSALAIIHGLVKSNAWRRRAGLIYIDVKTMFKFVAFSCGLLSNVFFAVIFGYSLYWLLFFKKQDIFNIVLPTRDQEGYFIAYVTLAFVFKALDLIHLIAVQCTTDVFLMDWERSRGRLVQANDAAISKGTPAPVSIWRTYFVANEWNELQATRKCHTGLRLLLTLFLLEIVGLVHLTTTDPISSVNPDPNAYYGGYDVILRFAVATAVYLVIAAVQWIFFTIIYERFVEDILQNFVDLCSMANISVFILSASNYGHYIHGRSVHGFADTDMKEMRAQLKREEENLVGQRGLLPNTDQQSFEFLLQNKFQENYGRILQPLNLTRAEQQRANQAQSNRSGIKVDSILDAYGIMNKFLSAFIDHGMTDIDYLVKDKLLLEKILDMEFYDPLDKGFLFNDDGHSFDQVLFFGHESTLLLFELLLFCVVDLIFQNYLMAGIVTFVISMALCKLRSSFGRYNLAKKTLVDERFLI